MARNKICSRMGDRQTGYSAWRFFQSLQANSRAIHLTGLSTLPSAYLQARFFCQSPPILRYMIGANDCTTKQYTNKLNIFLEICATGKSDMFISFTK
jgi:hypothetical protein